MNVGKALRAIREQKGIKLESMAIDMGVSASTLSRAERLVSNPRLSLLQAMADYLDVPLSEVFRQAVPVEARAMLELKAAYADDELELLMRLRALPDDKRVLARRMLQTLLDDQ